MSEDSEPPSAPVGLSAIWETFPPLPDPYLLAHWDRVDGATGYRIQADRRDDIETIDPILIVVTDTMPKAIEVQALAGPHSQSAWTKSEVKHTSHARLTVEIAGFGEVGRLKVFQDSFTAGWVFFSYDHKVWPPIRNGENVPGIVTGGFGSGDPYFIMEFTQGLLPGLYAFAVAVSCRGNVEQSLWAWTRVLCLNPPFILGAFHHFGQVRFTWQPSPEAVAYLVQVRRHPDENPDPVLVKTPYFLYKPTGDGPVFIKVQAIGDAGYPLASPAAEREFVLPLPPAPPHPLLDVRIVPSTTQDRGRGVRALNISWAPQEGAYYDVSFFVPGQSPTTTTVTIPQVTIALLESWPDGPYSVSLYSMTGAQPDPVSFQICAVELDEPTGLVGQWVIFSESLTISCYWKPVPRAHSYWVGISHDGSMIVQTTKLTQAGIVTGGGPPKAASFWVQAIGSDGLPVSPIAYCSDIKPG